MAPVARRRAIHYGSIMLVLSQKDKMFMLLWLWLCLSWTSANFVFVPVISDRPKRFGGGSYTTTYHLNIFDWQWATKLLLARTTGSWFGPGCSLRPSFFCFC